MQKAIFRPYLSSHLEAAQASPRKRKVFHPVRSRTDRPETEHPTSGQDYLQPPTSISATATRGGPGRWRCSVVRPFFRGRCGSRYKSGSVSSASTHSANRFRQPNAVASKFFPRTKTKKVRRVSIFFRQLRHRHFYFFLLIFLELKSRGKIRVRITF